MALELHISAGELCSFPHTSGISGYEIQCRDLIPFPAIYHSRKRTRQLELLQVSLLGAQRRNIVLSCAAWERGRGGRGGAEGLRRVGAARICVVCSHRLQPLTAVGSRYSCRSRQQLVAALLFG